MDRPLAAQKSNAAFMLLIVGPTVLWSESRGLAAQQPKPWNRNRFQYRFGIEAVNAVERGQLFVAFFDLRRSLLD